MCEQIFQQRCTAESKHAKICSKWSVPADGEVNAKIIKKHCNTPIRNKGLISTECMSDICSIDCAEETEISTSTIITHTDPPRRMPIHNLLTLL